MGCEAREFFKKTGKMIIPLTGTPFYDPSQFQTVIDRFDELLATLKRP